MSAFLAAPADIPLDKILIASLVLIALVVVGLLVVSQVKKRLTSEEAEKGQPGGFTLSDLRELHKSGQMSDEEFDRAKKQIIDAAKRASAREAADKQSDPGGKPL
jgi:hypothetical protein